MKKSVIFLIALIISMPISFAYEEKIYVYGNNLIASKESNNQDINYYHQDYLSSNRITSNNNGGITGKNTQEPYGADFEEKGTKEALENDYKYTGKEEDNSLYYFGARYYEPSSGRFISVDPIFDPGISPYAYANNNPLKYVDPTGRRIVIGGNDERRKTILDDLKEMIGAEVITRFEDNQYVLELTEEYNGQKTRSFEFLKALSENKKTVRINFNEEQEPLYKKITTKFSSGVIYTQFLPTTKFVSDNAFVPESESLPFEKIPRFERSWLDVFGIPDTKIERVTASGFSEVYYTDDLVTYDKKIVPRFVLLGHELGHALAYFEGRQWYDVRGYFNSLEDARDRNPALYYENILREEAGLDIRKTFP